MYGINILFMIRYGKSSMAVSTLRMLGAQYIAVSIWWIVEA